MKLGWIESLFNMDYPEYCNDWVDLCDEIGISEYGKLLKQFYEHPTLENAHIINKFIGNPYTEIELDQFMVTWSMLKNQRREKSENPRKIVVINFYLLQV